MDENIRKKIIISVDDFGISDLTNRNILELVRMKKVNRVSVMSEGEIIPEEIRELLNSGVKLDIHLELENATEKKDRKLKAGVLGRGLDFVWKIFFGKNGKNLVEKKWEEQIEKFKTIFGKYPDGINSHEHVHFFPPYFKITSDLGKKYEISYIRLASKSFKGDGMVCFILNCLRKIDLKNLKSSRMITSDYVVSFDWLKNPEIFLNNLPEGKTELVVHPEREEEFEFIKK